MSLKNNLIKFITISSIYSTSLTGLLGSDAGSRSDQDVDMMETEDLDEITAMEQLLASLQEAAYQSEGAYDEKVFDNFLTALNQQDYEHCKEIIGDQVPDVSIDVFARVYSSIIEAGAGELVADMNHLLTPGKYLAIDNSHASIWAKDQLILNFSRAQKISNPESLLKVFEVVSETLGSREKSIKALRSALNGKSAIEISQIPLLVALDHHHFLSDKILAMLIHYINVGEPLDNLNQKISVTKALKQAELLSKELEHALIEQDSKLAQVLEFAHSNENRQSGREDAVPGVDNLALVLSSGSGQFVLPFSLLTQGGLQKFEDEILAAIDSPELFEKKLIHAVETSDLMTFSILMAKGQNHFNVGLILKVFNAAGKFKNHYVASSFAAVIQGYEYLPEVSNATKSYLLSVNEAHRAAAEVVGYYWEQYSRDEKLKPENDLARMTLVATQVLSAFIEDESKFPYTKKGLNVLVSFLTREKKDCNGDQWSCLGKLPGSFNFESLMSACVHWNKNLKFPPDIRTSVR